MSKLRHSGSPAKEVSAPIPGQGNHDRFMMAFRGSGSHGVPFAELTPDIQRCWAAAEILLGKTIPDAPGWWICQYRPIEGVLPGNFELRVVHVDEEGDLRLLLPDPGQSGYKVSDLAHEGRLWYGPIHLSCG